MNILDLKLYDFRNYREFSAEFDPGVNLIVGNNAQGKTNLLEDRSSTRLLMKERTLKYAK